MCNVGCGLYGTAVCPASRTAKRRLTYGGPGGCPPFWEAAAHVCSPRGGWLPTQCSGCARGLVRPCGGGPLRSLRRSPCGRAKGRARARLPTLEPYVARAALRVEKHGGQTFGAALKRRGEIRGCFGRCGAELRDDHLWDRGACDTSLRRSVAQRQGPNGPMLRQQACNGGSRHLWAVPQALG